MSDKYVCAWTYAHKSCVPGRSFNSFSMDLRVRYIYGTEWSVSESLFEQFSKK